MATMDYEGWLRAGLRCCVVVREDVDAARRTAARRVAQGLGLALVGEDEAEAGGFDLALVETGARLELRVLRGDPLIVGGHGVASELSRIDTRSGPGRSLGQPLLKAVGIKRGNTYRPAVFDATAGLGEDAWVLASFGCMVSACERNPITHALFQDGLQRACLTHEQVALRIGVLHDDAGGVLQHLAEGDADRRPDVVYLDPMFPPGRKTAERKAMRVLRYISGDDDDAGVLLDQALNVARRRVVVKRPLRAQPLQGRTPPLTYKGKSLRFDVYLTAGPGR